MEKDTQRPAYKMICVLGKDSKYCLRIFQKNDDDWMYTKHYLTKADILTPDVIGFVKELSACHNFIIEDNCPDAVKVEPNDIIGDIIGLRHAVKEGATLIQIKDHKIKSE